MEHSLVPGGSLKVALVAGNVGLARQKAQQTQELKQKAEAEALYEATKEAEKRRIMNADERKEFLTKLIEGKRTVKRLFVIDGEVIEHPSEPDAADKIRAIAELNKMGGDYAPTKVANTDKEGNNVYNPPSINIYTMPPPEEAD